MLRISSKFFSRHNFIEKALPSFSIVSKYFSASGLDFSSIFSQKQQSIKQKHFSQKQFDAVVIGGGSGGLAFVLQAQRLGLDVAIVNYVKPSPIGTKWGLGGTCVNVGCIPKKLIHNAGLIKQSLLMSNDYGWRYITDKKQPQSLSQQNLSHDWNSMIQNIQNYIKKINFGYVSKLRQIGVPYINAHASFKDKHTLKLDNLTALNAEQEAKNEIKAKKFILAVGGRPRYPQDTEGPVSESVITSDDLFSLKYAPKNTLVIGGGYIAIQCAGFLKEIGSDVTMINRSTFLRQFDKDISARIVQQMELIGGIQMHKYTRMKKIEKLSQNKYKVTLDKNDGAQKLEKQFDTILVAIGRDPSTNSLNLQNVGVELKSDGKIACGSEIYKQNTTSENIFAIGDCMENMPELMPVAARSGVFLARRLHAEKNQKAIKPFQYKNIPTAIFSPNEYSFVGLSEEQAVEKYKGYQNLQIYLSEATSLERSIYSNNSQMYYTKIICQREWPQKVVGIHYLGPNAGQIIGGYGLAMSKGLNFQDIDQSFGVHPTTAQEIHTLRVTKRSGDNYQKTEC